MTPPDDLAAAVEAVLLAMYGALADEVVKLLEVPPTTVRRNYECVDGVAVAETMPTVEIEAWDWDAFLAARSAWVDKEAGDE